MAKHFCNEQLISQAPLKRRPNSLTPLRNKNTFCDLWGRRSDLNTSCGHSKSPQKKQQHFHGSKKRCNDLAHDVQQNKVKGRAWTWLRDFTGKAALPHLELPHPKALQRNTPGKICTVKVAKHCMGCSEKFPAWRCSRLGWMGLAGDGPAC